MGDYTLVSTARMVSMSRSRLCQQPNMGPLTLSSPFLN
jgi:hypothetical protein